VGIRITLSDMLSASCSNLSPGLFTAIFSWTVGGASRLTGVKKVPVPALAKKDRLAVCTIWAEVVVVDFFALVFMVLISHQQCVSKNALTPLYP
jgi:hypothetical protein